MITGCDVIYNLQIDKKDYIEDIETISYYADYAGFNQIVLGDRLESIDLNILNKPLLYNNMVSDNSYYKTKKKDDGVIFGLYLNGKFKNNNNNSRAVSVACNEYKIFKKNNIYNLVARDFVLFDRYPDLNSITVKVTSAYNILDNNADSVKKNVYIWNINRDNYKNKTISLSYREKIIFDPMITFDISLCIICIICLILYLFARNKYLRKNSL